MVIITWQTFECNFKNLNLCWSPFFKLEYQKQQCASTRLVVERVYNSATLARNGSEGSLNKMTRLRNDIRLFLGGIVNRAEDIEKVTG